MKRYQPAPSMGWAWLIAMGLFLLALPVPALLDGTGPFLLMLPFTWPFGIAFLVMAWWFPTLHYELGPAELVLCYGPYRYSVPLREIQTVARRNLALSLWSSVRFPGFAMWTVPYGDVGSVFMCATRSLTDILYIVTPGRKYGITPANEDEFLADLTSHLKG